MTGLAASLAGQATIAEAEGTSCPHAEIVKTRGLAEQRMVAKAISYNEGLCEAALTKRYDKLADKPCPHIARLSAEDPSSIALPEDLAQGGPLMYSAAVHYAC